MTGNQNGWGKVFIALRYQPQLPAWTCESLIGLVQFGMRQGDRRSYVYSKTMHKAANTLAREFLESDCDSMCFIDSDAVFGTGALEELRSDPEGAEYDVLQAFTVKRGWPPEPMFLTEQPQQPGSNEKLRGLHLVTNLPLDPDFIYQVDAVSLHFTLIRRSVFERLLEPEGARYTYWFEYSRDNGEDVTFSQNARRAGAKLGMTTRLKVGHVSEMVTGWDTMVDWYDRKFAYAEGEPPASLTRFQPYFKLQKQLAALIAEYTGEDADDVYQKSCTGVLPVADKWNVERPQTPDEVRAFYGKTGEYFYDLIKWNSTPAYQRILSRLANVKGERILEIGGGIGTMTEFLVTHGNAVDYYDVPGVLKDFAAWRFARLPEAHKARVQFVERWPVGVYDRVIAVDVLEHIHPDEIGMMLEGLVSALKPGGILFAHNNWSKQDGLYPFHYDHIDAWQAFIWRHGLKQIDDLTWQKPASETQADIEYPANEERWKLTSPMEMIR